jgi:hypothetical protein
MYLRIIVGEQGVVWHGDDQRTIMAFEFRPELAPDEIRGLPYIEDRDDARHEAAKLGLGDSLWLEFGVAHGKSAKIWLEHLPEDCGLHLFDVFTGLPEEWDTGDGKVPVGRFACEAPKFDDHRVKVFGGLFQDVLPSYTFSKKVGLAHIDCDIYSGAICALKAITPHLQKGTVMVFDEIYGYPTYEDHEWKALSECPSIHIDWLWRSMWSACGRIK